MSSSPVAASSRSISKEEFLSSLPPWRRFLARLNWHPVVEYEIRAIEFERRKTEHEKRMKQLESEIAREKELNARLAALWPSSNTPSSPVPTPGDGSMP